MGCARSTPAKPPAEAASASSTKPSAESAAYAPARLPTLNTTTTSPSAAAVQIPTQCGALAQPPAAPSETVAPPDDPIAAVHVPTQAEALAAWDARLRAEPVYKKCQLAHAKQTEAERGSVLYRDLGAYNEHRGPMAICGHLKARLVDTFPMLRLDPAVNPRHFAVGILRKREPCSGRW